MYFADFISGSRNFKQHLTSGVLILIHSADACILVVACVDCARVHLKTLSSLQPIVVVAVFFFRIFFHIDNNR